MKHYRLTLSEVFWRKYFLVVTWSCQVNDTDKMDTMLFNVWFKNRSQTFGFLGSTRQLHGNPMFKAPIYLQHIQSFHMKTKNKSPKEREEERPAHKTSQKQQQTCRQSWEGRKCFNYDCAKGFGVTHATY